MRNVYPWEPTRPERFGMWLRRAMCQAFGHNLESDDYATPDSGYMGMHCKRCGESWGGQLY